jgi:hypothetical protein|tara:strand:+ start:1166 stop:1372 length:207 start_codon:yes stop_codon:yes gene_type:complete
MASMVSMMIEDAIKLLQMYPDQSEEISIVWQRKSQSINDTDFVQIQQKMAVKKPSFIHKNPSRHNIDY